MRPELLFLVIKMLIRIDAFNNFADTTCGKQNTATEHRTGKIVGGENAEKAEFPWLVSLTRRGGHFCGGTVINRRFIMTAGHCLCTGIDQDILKPGQIKVTLSQYDLSNKDSEAYQSTVKTITVHPGYSCHKTKDDIAILELDVDLEWSSSVLPACFPFGTGHDKHSTFDSILATVAGWGWTNEENSKGGRAKTLQKAKVNVINTEKCQTWYKSQGKKTKIQESQMCAGHEKGGIDACWADSGGPLMVNISKEEGKDDGGRGGLDGNRLCKAVPARYIHKNFRVHTLDTRGYRQLKQDVFLKHLQLLRSER